MSSILRLSTANALNFTYSTIIPPAISVSICKDCLNKRITAAHRSRPYSTNESPSTSFQKKKAKLKTSKKYAELLRVSGNKATHKKIFLGKLNANHVQMFAEQPGLVLGSLNNKTENNVSKPVSNDDSDARIEGSTEKPSAEELASDNIEENDCDKFGILSNSNRTSNTLIVKNKLSFKENNSDNFGTLSNAKGEIFTTSGKHQKNCGPELLTENDSDKFGKLLYFFSKNTEIFSRKSQKKQIAKFSSVIEENERTIDKENNYSKIENEIKNDLSSETFSKNLTCSESSSETQKFDPEMESLIKSYLQKKSDVNLMKDQGNIVNREETPKSNVIKAHDLAKNESKTFSSSRKNKKIPSIFDVSKKHELKSFATEKTDHLVTNSGNSLPYESLEEFKMVGTKKRNGINLLNSTNEFKSQIENAQNHASNTLGNLNTSNEFTANFFNSYSNKKINVRPSFSSAKQTPKPSENIFKGRSKRENNLEIANELFLPGEVSKKIIKHMKPSNKEKSSKSSTTRTDVDTGQNKKEILFNEILLSYADVCVQTDMIEEAYNRITKERARLKHKNFKIVDIEIYNTIMHGYARQGNWGKIEEILRILNEDNFTYNEQTYAAVFDCLACIRNDYNKDFVKFVSNSYIKELKAQGLDLGDIFNKTQLINDQREKILSVIHMNYPNYEIPKMEYERNSNCELLRRLDETSGQYIAQTPEEITQDMLKKFIEEQIIIESGLLYKIKAIHEPPFNYQEKSEKLFEEWRPILRDAFIKNVKILKYNTENLLQKSNLYVYLHCLPVDEFVECMLFEIKRSISDSIDPPTYMATALLGTKIWQRYAFLKKERTGELDKTIKLYKKYAEWYLSPHGSAMNARQYWQTLLENHSEGPHINVRPKKWPYAVLRDLGHFLYQIIIKEIKVDINLTRVGDFKSRMVPVFYTQLQESATRTEEIIKFHPLIQRIFQACNLDTLTFSVDQIPMVSPPKPWCHVNSGGYLLQKTSYTRSLKGIGNSSLQYDEIPQTQLYPTFDSLNQLQSVPWKINEDVLDIAIKVFNEGGSEELDVPSLPNMQPEKTKLPKDLTGDQIREIMKERKKATQKKLNEYSLWCEALYKLSLANHYRNKIFWTPQNMDFRGRVYPVPPHITHLGADFYRALFLFAKGKELGPNGLDWLKIHTINLTGTHKRNTIKERLDYANEILPEILDSANRPLDGSKWWMKSDEQWQTLAACIEIKKALDCSNPEKYVSRFPVHQDGSCNGLQHYAALGRDVIGAESVNLTPAESPQDVYSVVVGIVERKRKEDEAAGIPIAKILDGFVSRKVIKQTIMTTVYGVTPFGAKLQIKGQLEDLKDFPQDHAQWAASYLSQKTFQSLNEMFTSATEIQNWFVNCAGTISSIGRDYVRWVTPLGLPVEQPYAKLVTVKGKEGDKQILLPNAMKQKNAFPPNFVHSLDSSHMMLTSLHCEQMGVTFSSIHDCFWTHPSTVEIMNKICREQFIALHSQPILQDLSQYFCEIYKNLPQDKKNIFTKIPPRGDFDLSSVMKSIYFFS